MIRKDKLFVIAGLLWIFAGIMVSKIGVTALYSRHSIWIIALATIVYLIFYMLIFSKLVKKHENRIMKHPKGRLPWYNFFDKKSYIIMFVMIFGGVILRKSGLLPLSFFAFFYTGLGFALFSCGIRFVYVFYRINKVNRLN